MSVIRKGRLSRLEPRYYRGHAWVHWAMGIEGRQTGWLSLPFHYKFREVLAHDAFRYQIACPIYCLMPDHIHLLWCGLSGSSDQRVAMKTFRKDLNDCLKRIGYKLQRQPYDHVLLEEESERSAIENVALYVAHNPERKRLVPTAGFARYPHTGCLLPGYPQIKLFQQGGWDVIWRTLSFLRRTECFRKADPKYARS